MTNYTLHGKNIVHMTQGSNSLHFFYDASNKPAIVDFNGTKYAYVHNLQGDIVAILDSNGSVVVQYKYDAWGRPISKTGSMASTLGTVQPFRYRGYVFDEETGLYYLRSRYYNPVLTRFVIADIFIKPAFNQYRYCAPNPIALTDPEGTTEWSCCYFDPFSDPMNINRSFFSGGVMTVDMGNALPVSGLKIYDVLTTMPVGYCSDLFQGALSPSNITTLYRSVSDGEASSIEMTGQFSVIQGQMESKQFAFDANEAWTFGDIWQNTALVSVDINTNTLYSNYYVNQSIDSTLFRHGVATIYDYQMRDFNDHIYKDTIQIIRK